jgi:hypothetical protein
VNPSGNGGGIVYPALVSSLCTDILPKISCAPPWVGGLQEESELFSVPSLFRFKHDWNPKSDRQSKCFGNGRTGDSRGNEMWEDEQWV